MKAWALSVAGATLVALGGKLQLWALLVRARGRALQFGSRR